jgi:hypothetical protein
MHTKNHLINLGNNLKSSILIKHFQLMFMHWYHHALTGYFAFHTFYAENAYMVWVVWMNYAIHFAMYRWVFWSLKALKSVKEWCVVKEFSE